MSMGITGLVRPQNASYIIERPKQDAAMIGRRGNIQCLKRTFPGGCSSILRECNGCGGGEETDGHQQTKGFSIASRFSSKRRVAFHKTKWSSGLFWGTLPI
jgi:hypothetical protein